MGYWHENAQTLDTSGVFTTLKGCIAAAELISEREKVPYVVYAQTSTGDMLVGKTAEYETCRKEEMWFFDYDESWPFTKE
jgi:hypothetical protein